ncbi:hypothetical protein IAU60_006804 [Kwoniella sp. DSM 27419]
MHFSTSLAILSLLAIGSAVPHKRSSCSIGGPDPSDKPQQLAVYGDDGSNDGVGSWWGGWSGWDDQDQDGQDDGEGDDTDDDDADQPDSGDQATDAASATNIASIGTTSTSSTFTTPTLSTQESAAAPPTSSSLDDVSPVSTSNTVELPTATATQIDATSSADQTINDAPAITTSVSSDATSIVNDPTVPTASVAETASSQSPDADSSSSPAAPSASSSPIGVTAASTPGQNVGLGLNSTAWHGLAGGAPGLDWYWNWGMQPFDLGNVEFVPAIWGEVAAKRFDGTVPQGTKHILSFNEPDQSSAVGGSDIPDVHHAAQLHQDWTAKVPSGIKIGAPAVARGGDKTWFKSWIDACEGRCKFDFVPIHFYGTKVEEMISYIKSFPAQGKPIWVTEYACIDFGTTPMTVCNPEDALAFIETASEWFRGEGASIVQRWAWFGAFPESAGQGFGLEEADGSLNSLGKKYLSL